MSVHNDIDVTCGQCGKEFKGTVWTSINARQDPELKDLLLGGELNILFCPECSHTFFYEHFLLYLDPVLNLAAYVYPPDEEDHKKDLEEMMKRGFADAQAAFDPKDRMKCAPELMFGLDELQRRIHEEDQRHLTEEVTKAKTNLP
jgi:hypothetical protein